MSFNLWKLLINVSEFLEADFAFLRPLTQLIISKSYGSGFKIDTEHKNR